MDGLVEEVVVIALIRVIVGIVIAPGAVYRDVCSSSLIFFFVLPLYALFFFLFFFNSLTPTPHTHCAPPPPFFFFKLSLFPLLWSLFSNLLKHISMKCIGFVSGQLISDCDATFEKCNREGQARARGATRGDVCR